MRLLRSRTTAAVIAAAALAAGGALALWRQPAPGVPAGGPAAELVAAAAAARPVGATDRQVWDAQEAARRNPTSAQARAILAEAYLQKARESGDPGYYAKAEQAVAEALRLEPDNLDALVASGTLALARHQFREALAIGERARGLAPRVPRVYGVIADAQVELGMYDEAVQTIQTMVDMRPDLSSYSRVAYARELYGDLDGAEQAMGMAARAGGPSAESVAWARAQLGNLRFARGDLAGAEAHYLAALEQSQDYVYALAGLARVRAAQGRDADAERLYGRAIERVPLPEFVIALGELREARGDAEGARREYDLVRAMQRLLGAGGVDTDMELALFEADHGDPAAAVELARASYQRRPSVRGADALAWALYRAGRPQEARPFAAEATRLGTRDSLTLYHAGMVAAAAGDEAAARDLLGRAIQQNPFFSPLQAPAARKALGDLTATAHR